MSAFGKFFKFASIAAIAAGAAAIIKKQKEAAAAQEPVADADAAGACTDDDLKAAFQNSDEADAASGDEADADKTDSNSDVIKKDLKEILTALAGNAKDAGSVIGKNVSDTYATVKEKVTTFAEEKGINEKIDSVVSKFTGSKDEEPINVDELKEDAENLKEELENEIENAYEEKAE